MSRLVYSMMASLDGFMEATDGDLEWGRPDEELHAFVNDRVRNAGAFVYGRRTYETMVEHWPTADANPSAPDNEVEFAHIWQAMPKFVCSRSLERVAPGHELIRDVDELAKLKERPGGDLLIGGAQIASAAMRHGLVDGCEIYVHPVVLGGGKPLFQEPGRIDLRLVETRRFGSGVVLLSYAAG